MYGLNKDIKKYIDKKIDKNKSFLENMTFYTEDYKLVSMYDSDMNANLSPERYFAEVNNRVNTLFKVSKELDLVPAFLTITAPPEYHNKSKYYNGSTPRETALYLSKLWHKFMQKRIIRDIKQNVGHNMIYIRVYEPHKSGVPHLHAMIFVPKEYLKAIKKKFFEHFTKYHIKRIALKFIDRFDYSKKYDGVTGAIAYILKYMNKTFKHAKEILLSSYERYKNSKYSRFNFTHVIEDKRIPHGYFAYHGIRRFITSQTLIPLWIYRKIKGDEQNRDLHKLTKQYKLGHIFSTFDKEYIMQRYIKTDKTEFSCGEVEITTSVEEKIIYQKNHFISEQFKTSQLVIEDIPTSWTNKKYPIPNFMNGVLISHYFNGKNQPYKKHITQMTDYELYSLHNTYDIENGSYVKYLAIKNLMIDRNLSNKQKHDLNKFDINKYLGLACGNQYKWYSAKCIGLVG